MRKFYKLYNIKTVRDCLSRLQQRVLSESISNDIFLHIDKEFIKDNKLVQSGCLYVYDMQGNAYSNRVKKVILLLLKNVNAEVACLPGRKGETVKTRSNSLCYGKTFIKETKKGDKVRHGSYSVNTDLMIDKWDFDNKKLVSS